MNDDWIRDLAVRQKEQDEQRKRDSDRRREIEAERTRLIREQLPPLWQELVSHLKRKEALFNKARGMDAFSMEIPQGAQDPGLTLTYNDGDASNTYIVRFAGGSLESRVNSRGWGEGSGDLTLAVRRGTVSFATASGSDDMTPEQAADHMLQELLRSSGTVSDS